MTSPTASDLPHGGSPPPHTGTPPAATARRVLVVEDDAASRRALRMILAHAGWQVETAGTVAEAMRLLATGPSWVVLDLMLPDGDGSAVLEHIRDRALPIRVTVATGISDPARLADVQRLGPQELLQKPIRIGDLLQQA